MAELQNANPTINTSTKHTRVVVEDDDDDEDKVDGFDTLEIFDLIRGINDPEHPLTLEQLNVATVRGPRCTGEGAMRVGRGGGGSCARCRCCHVRAHRAQAPWMCQ
jgi:hypothetical protein